MVDVARQKSFRLCRSRRSTEAPHGGAGLGDRLLRKLLKFSARLHRINLFQDADYPKASQRLGRQPVVFEFGKQPFQATANFQTGRRGERLTYSSGG